MDTIHVRIDQADQINGGKGKANISDKKKNI